MAYREHHRRECPFLLLRWCVFARAWPLLSLNDYSAASACLSLRRVRNNFNGLASPSTLDTARFYRFLALTTIELLLQTPVLTLSFVYLTGLEQMGELPFVTYLTRAMLDAGASGWQIAGLVGMAPLTAILFIVWSLLAKEVRDDIRSFWRWITRQPASPIAGSLDSHAKFIIEV